MSEDFPPVVQGIIIAVGIVFVAILIINLPEIINIIAAEGLLG